MFTLAAALLALVLSPTNALPTSQRFSRAVSVDPIPSTAPSNETKGCSASSTSKFLAKFSSTNHANITLALSPELGGNRTFLVHLPTAYSPSTPHALVVSFHGFKSSALKQERITGLSEAGVLINGKGIVAVYPEGQFGPGKNGNESIRAWQGAPYSPPGVDDVAFTQELLSHLSDNLCLDSNRFYASGKSNGGGFTNLLACTPQTANLFAAFAPVSPALYAGANPTNCAPGRPVPIVNFHGLSDRIIPFGGQNADKEGQTEYATPNITQFREAWAERNGCGSAAKVGGVVKLSSAIKLKKQPAVSHPHTNTTLKAFPCDAQVNGFTVDGLGHSWPGTAGLDGGVTTFNATTANIVPFFETYALGQ
ncbi:alpha/beta-hydrolase [Mycena amicta]|nr:alpha/beta-hydrolase [Mycena amicta]